ncbi:MAG: hypothetical protein KDC42_04175 [Ignavibacteriae bacterium]|nr:hypothetical protein [Ignavibacteriota bacterium]
MTESTRSLTFTPEEIEDGKLMAILAWIIFLVPLFAARDKRFAMFHTEQAIVLLIVFVPLYILITIITVAIGQVSGTMACIVSILSFGVWILYLVMWILGLVSAIQGKAKELPFIGQFGAKLNLVK